MHETLAAGLIIALLDALCVRDDKASNNNQVGQKMAANVRTIFPHFTNWPIIQRAIIQLAHDLIKLQEKQD